MENSKFDYAKKPNTTLSRNTPNSSQAMYNAVKKPKTLASRSRVRRSERLKKRPQMQKTLKSHESSEEDDKEEVEEKIDALKQIVPGGEELGVDMLFEKTAGYILALQLQIKALNYLTTFVEASEDQQRKLGG